MGLTYDQTHDIPIGELMDLISIDLIKAGMASLCSEDDEDVIPNVR